MYSILQNESHASNRSCHRARILKMPRVTPFFQLDALLFCCFHPSRCDIQFSSRFFLPSQRCQFFRALKTLLSIIVHVGPVKGGSSVCQAMFFSQDVTRNQILSLQNQNLYEIKYLKHRNGTKTVYEPALSLS